MANVSDSELNVYLVILLNQTNTAIFRARKKELLKYKLTPTQAGILFTIENLSNEATLAKISRCIFMEPQSVIETIKKMEDEGLLNKSSMNSNRTINIKLTQKGLDALVKSMERRSIHKIMSLLTREQKRQLWSCLSILREKALEESSLERKAIFQFKDVVSQI